MDMHSCDYIWHGNTSKSCLLISCRLNSSLCCPDGTKPLQLECFDDQFDTCTTEPHNVIREDLQAKLHTHANSTEQRMLKSIHNMPSTMSSDN